MADTANVDTIENRTETWEEKLQRIDRMNEELRDLNHRRMKEPLWYPVVAGAALAAAAFAIAKFL